MADFFRCAAQMTDEIRELYAFLKAYLNKNLEGNNYNEL